MTPQERWLEAMREQDDRERFWIQFSAALLLLGFAALVAMLVAA